MDAARIVGFVSLPPSGDLPFLCTPEILAVHRKTTVEKITSSPRMMAIVAAERARWEAWSRSPIHCESPMSPVRAFFGVDPAPTMIVLVTP